MEAPRLSSVDRWVDADPEHVEQLAAAAAPMVLAGPGVVAEGAVPGLHALATAGSLGVLNTWGAKGVFDWRSRHHWATVGLQEHDFRLGGLADADLIVATGIDPEEAPPERWQLAPSITVPPGALDPLAERWWRPRVELAVPPLRERLARVTQHGWARDALPLSPSRVTLHYSRVLGSGGLIAADPGVAGFWVARTFPTTEIGSARVPASRGCRGFAAGCALAARLRRPDRPVLAVVDGPLDDETREVLDVAASHGVAVPVELWQPDGDVLGPDEHLERLARVIASSSSWVGTLATDDSQLDAMVDAAGPVVAWGGIR